MSKVRVYEVARELGVDNRELLHRIASLGIQVRNHMSALDPAEVDRVKRALEKDKADNTVEERIRKTVIRRRTVAKKKPAASEAVEADAPKVVEEPKGDARPKVAAPSKADEALEPVAEPPKAAEEAPASSAEPETKRADAIPPPPPPEAEPVAAPAEPEAPAAAPAEPEPEPEYPPRRAMPSQPAPASERLAYDNLPPGVVQRGSATAPAAGRISDAARARIVSQHAQRQGAAAPRRVELGRRDLGQPGRPGTTRPGRRKLVPSKKGQKTEITVPSAQKRIIRIEDQIGLQVLAQRMSMKATDVLMKLIQLGMSNININSTLDSDTAKIIASEFGYEVENVAKSEDELIQEARGGVEDREEDRVTRAPIVTVMGHVDHGKTSLLDHIRKANVAGGEAGGITQHIGAYRVDTKKGPIVFLDTPGHEAFTSMRARGAQATDVVVLVVAADDGVMPQTKEAVNHAKAAGVPIIVAVNKIDKPDARPQQIRQELVGQGLQPEEWGGDTLFVDVSAIEGTGVDTLLESIALQAELLELIANPELPGKGIVLEAYLDRGRGPVVNVLVREGTLNQGDMVVSGAGMGKVRALTDERGRRLKSAGPATPVEVLGLSELPSSGDGFFVVNDEAKAKALVDDRQRAIAAKAAVTRTGGLEAIQEMLKKGEVQELNLVIKSDVHGSTEALVKALTELSTDKVKVNVIHTGVGGITENDVMLATASNAIIIGFNVRPAGKAGATAKSENIEIRTYRIIYEAVDDVRKAMEGLLAPEYREKDLGKAEVRQTFSIPKIGTIAGCYVTEGKILRNGKARLVRDSVQIWEGSLGSLRRFKEDAREVASGYECGIGLEGYNDLKEGDVIECFEMEQIKATL